MYLKNIEGGHHRCGLRTALDKYLGLIRRQKKVKAAQNVCNSGMGYVAAESQIRKSRPLSAASLHVPILTTDDTEVHIGCSSRHLGNQFNAWP